LVSAFTKAEKKTKKRAENELVAELNRVVSEIENLSGLSALSISRIKQ
jgi:hypothetical protein